MDVQKDERLPPVSQPFLKAHFIAVLQSDMKWKEGHREGCESAQKGMSEKYSASSTMFPQVTFNPLELKTLPELLSFTLRRALDEGRATGKGQPLSPRRMTGSAGGC